MAFPSARPVSSSAPQSYRAKKKNPVSPEEEKTPPRGPMGQNNGRMTGPPMQKGPGAGSMFANGRTGQPQGAMPRSPNMGAGGPGPMRVHGQMQGHAPMTPNQPMARMGPARPMGQMQGGHPRGVSTDVRLMADGGAGDMMEDTPPIGGMPDDEGGDQAAPATAQGSPDPMGGGSDMGPMPAIKPEAVNYHDDPHACQLCQYFSQGNCSVLQMQVSPAGGCTAFEAGAGGGEPDGDEGTGSTGAGFTQNPAGTSGSPSLG